jgi:hypothetical protein
MASRHPTESYPTTYDFDESMLDAPNAQSTLPSWKEIDLVGHTRLSLDDADNLDGSPSNLDCLLKDTLGDRIADGDYDSSQDDSDEILERLQEQLSTEDNVQNAIGTLISN